MDIGIVGLGCVGTANREGFGHIGHNVLVHDTKLQTELKNLTPLDIIFLCLPTPSTPDGHCDTSIVRNVIKDLSDLGFKGLIAIRSTVTPGFTAAMQKAHPELRIALAPEFLRERCAVEDFISNHRLLAIGASNEADADLVAKAHGDLPQATVRLTPSEAEILKYFHNVFASTRVVFANIFFELCKRTGADYQKVKDSYVKTGKVNDLYFDVNQELRGYGGMCLPKDTKALAAVLQDLGLEFELIKAIDQDNAKFPTTVFSGMRSSD